MSLLYDQKRQMLILLSLRLKQTYSYVESKPYCAFHKHANSEVQKPTDDCVFAAVNHLNGPLRKQNFTLTGSKGQGL